jgi:CRP/FNR family transcriptional regulator, cyclic AMP receptor protein
VKRSIASGRDSALAAANKGKMNNYASVAPPLRWTRRPGVWTKRHNRTSEIKGEQMCSFDDPPFLASAGMARRIVKYRHAQDVYFQGDLAETIFYIQEGSIKLSVVNGLGKEGIVAVLGIGAFFGEGCLAGQNVRMATATTITSATLVVIEKHEMSRVLHAERKLSDCFLSHMLTRNIRMEEDLIDQLCNSSEKRLARTLVLLTQYGEKTDSHEVNAPISQETLANMVGTTRSRINLFMNKFRKMGLIKYDRQGIQINPSLMGAMLHG